VMRSLSRARHDINNPLTSALAEVQLLLLDGESDPGLAESMEIIQEQLRRIRDLVIGLSRFRPPSG
jgi:signal transduction histidine kinase